MTNSPLSLEGNVPRPAAQALIDKLGRFVPLGDAERRALARLARNAQQHRRGADLISEGDKPDSRFLLLDGWAFRYKSLVDGGRQILAYLFPGDLCDAQVFLVEEMDHSIGLLSDAWVARIPEAEMLDLVDRYPRIERALLWATLVDRAMLREWLLNLGQRDAMQRLSHLFCELCVRLHLVDQVDANGTFRLPLTQTQLADTAGITTVHVNRSLQRLRREGLICLKDGKLTILDFGRLSDIAGFNQTYLHAEGPSVEPGLRARLPVGR